MTSLKSPSVWSQTNNNFSYRPTGQDSELLPKGVYEVKGSQYGPYLTRIADSFSLPQTTYPLNQDFINKVLTSWKHLPHNVGVLLAGRKGTGKSVIARQIANLTDCPIIVVPKKVEGFESYLQNRPEQDIVLVIDEVEKHWGLDDKDKANELAELLSLLDGTQHGSSRMLTLLTANNIYNMDYLLDRPGRIRYYKNFNSIEQVDATLIIEELLEENQFKDDLLSLCEKIDGLTVDALIALITEINLHKQPASVLIEDLNLTLISNSYRVTFAKKTDKSLEEKIVIESNYLSDSHFSEYNLHDSWKVEGIRYGIISEVLAHNIFMLKVTPSTLEENSLNALKDLKLIKGTEGESQFLVKVEPIFTKSSHSMYKDFMNAI